MNRAMKKGKHPEGDAVRSDPTVSRGEDTTAPGASRVSGRSFFRCCLKRKTGSKVVDNRFSEDFDTSETYDYIVEKLVIKKVPIGLFARDDTRDKEEEEPEVCDCEGRKSPREKAKTVYSIAPAANPSLFYTSDSVQPGTSGFASGGTAGKILRFTSTEKTLDDANGGAIVYDTGTSILGRFTALHPNLKESERAPKDPCPLNATRSRRLLAEEISEISATRIDLADTSGTRKSVEVDGEKTASAVESSNVASHREIPARDKAPPTYTRNRNEPTSCFPFGRRYSASTIDEPPKSDNASVEKSTDRDSPEVKDFARNRNYTAVPVQVHASSALSEENTKDR